MTQFEFVMTAVSVFMSFGLVRLLDGVRGILRSERRYWVHSVWVLNRLITYVLLWWGSWSVQQFTHWNLVMFAMFLVPFCLIYLQSTTLVTTHPSEIGNWRSYFYEIRTSFFAIQFAFLLTLFLSTFVIGTVAVAQPLSIAYFISMVVAALGYFYSSHKVHAALAIFSMINVILGFSTQLYDPSDVILK